jgi:hypothetical protein
MTDDTQDFETDEDEDVNPTPDAEGVSYSAAATGKKTVFVQHPCTPAVKRKITQSGFRILDARYAPPKAPIIDGQTGKQVVAAKATKGKASGKAEE